MIIKDIGDKVSTNLIVQRIKQVLKKISRAPLSRKRFHNLIQQKIVGLAKIFNLQGFSEYRVQNVRADGRGGSIDVIWKANSRPFVVFEIDSFPRSKSIKKLLLVDAPFRFWICYGSKDPASLICDYDSGNLIKLIQLQNIRLKREKRKELNYHRLRRWIPKELKSKNYRCQSCGRYINHKGKCLPCNIAAKCERHR